MSEIAKMTATGQLATMIAEFQHRNESLHRHPVDGTSCAYCDLVGHYATKVLRDNPELAVKVLLETGALEQVAWRFEVKRQPGVPGPRYGFMSYLPAEAGHHGHERVYRLVTEENP